MDKVTILLVEDELLLRELVIAPLEEAGFNVLIAVNGEDAVALLEREGQAIRAVVTDVNLGSDVTGWHVGHHARKANPQMPVIYTTAQSTADWAAHGVPESIHITKPFVAVQIVTALANLLNMSSPPAA